MIDVQVLVSSWFVSGYCLLLKQLFRQFESKPSCRCGSRFCAVVGGRVGGHSECLVTVQFVSYRVIVHRALHWC